MAKYWGVGVSWRVGIIDSACRVTTCDADGSRTCNGDAEGTGDCNDDDTDGDNETNRSNVNADNQTHDLWHICQA